MCSKCQMGLDNAKELTELLKLVYSMNLLECMQEKRQGQTCNPDN